LAVLGTGIDIAYPRENTRLFAEIAEKGALVTEFAPGTQPLGGNFPRRNRIVSGMAQGVLVVEAAKKSGAMITITFALEEGRNVYCVPGSIYLPNSIGCHTLIKEGAMLVDNPNDILRDLNIATVDPFMPSLFKINKSLNRESKHILDLLAEGPQTLEILMQASGLPMASLSEALLNLEFKGSVAHMQDQRYYRI
jgi:DNA processing protein